MTSDEVIIVKSAADVAGVTAFAKTPTEAINGGKVTEVAVKSATWRGLLETAIAFCESLLRNMCTGCNGFTLLR